MASIIGECNTIIVSSGDHFSRLAFGYKDSTYEVPVMSHGWLECAENACDEVRFVFVYTATFAYEKEKTD